MSTRRATSLGALALLLLLGSADATAGDGLLADRIVLSKKKKKKRNFSEFTRDSSESSSESTSEETSQNPEATVQSTSDATTENTSGSNSEESSESSSEASSDGTSNSFGGESGSPRAVGMSIRNPLTARIAQAAAGEQPAADRHATAQRIISAYLLLNQSRVAHRIQLSGLSSAQIESLELDAADGEGADIETISQAFSLTTEEVSRIVAQVRGAHADDAGFSDALIAALAAEGRMAGELSRLTIDALYAQHTDGDCSEGSIVRSLSRASGVPAAEVAPIAARILEAHLGAQARQGHILSARALLAEDAESILDEIIVEVVAAHEASVLVQVDALLQQALVDRQG